MRKIWLRLEGLPRSLNTEEASLNERGPEAAVRGREFGIEAIDYSRARPDDLVVQLNLKYRNVSSERLKEAIEIFDKAGLPALVSLRKWEILHYHSGFCGRAIKVFFRKLDAGNGAVIKSFCSIEEFNGSQFIFLTTFNDDMTQRWDETVVAKLSELPEYVAFKVNDGAVDAVISRPLAGTTVKLGLYVYSTSDDYDDYFYYDLEHAWRYDYERPGWINLQRGGCCITGRQNAPVVYRRIDALAISEFDRMGEIQRLFEDGMAQAFVLTPEECSCEDDFIED